MITVCGITVCDEVCVRCMVIGEVCEMCNVCNVVCNEVYVIVCDKVCEKALKI